MTSPGLFSGRPGTLMTARRAGLPGPSSSDRLGPRYVRRCRGGQETNRKGRAHELSIKWRGLRHEIWMDGAGSAGASIWCRKAARHGHNRVPLLGSCRKLQYACNLRACMPSSQRSSAPCSLAAAATSFRGAVHAASVGVGVTVSEACATVGCWSTSDCVSK